MPEALAAVCPSPLLSAFVPVTLRPGTIEATPPPVPKGPRPIVTWATWIGVLTLASNASSLAWFLLVDPSLVAALLFWLMPLSLALGAADVAVYVRERRAVLRSSAPPRRWAIIVVLSLSLSMFVLVVLCVVLFHDAQLGNLDPGGL
jgi:hypothetical protein